MQTKIMVELTKCIIVSYCKGKGAQLYQTICIITPKVITKANLNVFHL